MKKMKVFTFIITYLFLITSIAGCNRPNSNGTEGTLDVTQAYQTVEARLTESSGLTPSALVSNTPSSLSSATATAVTNQATATQPATQPVITEPPAKKCDQAGAGVPIDVTIPDDTKLKAGESFTKIWRLKNVGTCTWTKDYFISVFSGDVMNAPASVALPGKVAPGESIDISVDLVAPPEAGTYQGNWKFKNANNEWFGIGPSGVSAFWVRIIVEQSITETVTPTVSGTPSGTETVPVNTPTPEIKVSGSVTLSPSDMINLDNLTLNPGSGEDLSYVIANQDDLILNPMGDALFGVYGDSPPSFNACQSTSLNNSPLALVNLYSGLNICYLTGKGRYGYLQILNLNVENHNLDIQITTWSSP